MDTFIVHKSEPGPSAKPFFLVKFCPVLDKSLVQSSSAQVKDGDWWNDVHCSQETIRSYVCAYDNGKQLPSSLTSINICSKSLSGKGECCFCLSKQFSSVPFVAKLPQY